MKGFLLSLVLSIVSITASAHLTAGTNYQIIPGGMRAPLQTTIPGKIQLTEFFSYGCIHCFHFEPMLQKWLKAHPKVVLRKVPVYFNRPAWLMLAKTYLVVNALGKADQMTPLIFNALHVAHKYLATPEEMAAFLADHGISASTFMRYYQSFSIAEQYAADQALIQKYRVREIPTVVIAGKYITNGTMAGSVAKLPEVMNQLYIMGKFDEK